MDYSKLSNAELTERIKNKDHAAWEWFVEDRLLPRMRSKLGTWKQNLDPETFIQSSVRRMHVAFLEGNLLKQFDGEILLENYFTGPMFKKIMAGWQARKGSRAGKFKGFKRADGEWGTGDEVEGRLDLKEDQPRKISLNVPADGQLPLPLQYAYFQLFPHLDLEAPGMLRLTKEVLPASKLKVLHAESEKLLFEKVKESKSNERKEALHAKHKLRPISLEQILHAIGQEDSKKNRDRWSRAASEYKKYAMDMVLGLPEQ